jgi:hypothetical protein
LTKLTTGRSGQEPEAENDKNKISLTANYLTKQIGFAAVKSGSFSGKSSTLVKGRSDSFQ